MHRTLLSAALFAAIAFSVGSAQAATFTYHGNLQDAGKPAEGTYDLQLTLYSSPEGGKVVAGPLIMYKVPVHEGTFSTEADFGQLTNVSGQSWLGVAVRNAGQGDFAALSARAPISAAETATNSSCPGSWSLDGNAGNPVGDYLGTADNQPLTFKVNGITAGQITPGKGAWFSQGTGFFGSSANGANAFAMGKGTNANGAESFAGGFGAFANQDGSFMWGDSATGGGITATTAVNQYIVRAGGGVGINSAPLTSATEVTISGSLLAADTNTDLAMFPRGSVWGYDMNVQGTAQADGSWNISQTNGSTYTNRLAITPTTVAVTGAESINGIPKTNNIELTIYPNGPTDSANVFMGTNGHTGGILMSAGNATTATSNDAGFYIDQYNGTDQQRKMAVNSAGVTINDPANIPSGASQGSLAIVNSPGLVNAKLTLFPVDAFQHIYYYLEATAGGYFLIGSQVPNGATTGAIEISRSGDVTLDEDLFVLGNATKPGGGVWSAPSDRRIKQNIVPISDAIDTVLELRPVSFHYTPEFRAMENNLPDKPYLGFVAQEFAEVFPDAVTRTNKHVPGAAANDPNILELDSNPALITTVAAVQELAVQAQDRDGEVAKLRGENAELRGKLDAVMTRLSKLESQQGE